MFRRSFVLQYAQALGVDPEEIAGELKHLNQFDDVPATPAAQIQPDRDDGLSFGFPLRGDLSGVSGSTLGSLIAAVGVMLACALIYSWWQTPREMGPAAKVETAAVQSPKQTTPAPAPAQPAPAQRAPVEAQRPEGQSDAGPLRVGLSADEKTWISISSDGKNIFANSLQPHETKIVVASEKVRIVIGNAGGLEISLNGKPIGPIGPRGQIRVVELTSGGFQIVPRKPPTLQPL